jgi:hypothetical protein
MLNTDRIQAVIATKARVGFDLAATEVAVFTDNATVEFTMFSDLAGELSKAKSADKAINAIISYNALAFQRATTAILRSTERGAEFSRGCREDLRKAFDG